ncbi:MAG TPA: FAD-dependent oxidoreductase, partial [Hansschlegelia sp.]
MSQYDLDLFVIGGGSGGVRAARISAQHGARVAIAEEFRFGGTCVIRGCVPKKLLVYASRFPDAFEDSAGFGWSIPEKPTFSWADLIAAKNADITRISGFYEENVARAGVTVHHQRAVIEDPHTVRLADGAKITAKLILIATGGAPASIDFPGGELAISSNEALDLPELPKRVIVQGGGYIALEFASIFAGLGAETTLIHRGHKILRGFDEDVRDDVQAGLAHRGVKFVMSDHVVGIERGQGGKVVRTHCGETIEADEVLFAIGRRPLTHGLGLEAAGVECDHHGAVVVDEVSQTSTPSIYAIGDVTNRMNLTPIAIREGHAFADRMFG